MCTWRLGGCFHAVALAVEQAVLLWNAALVLHRVVAGAI
jgi:hypothetical protein